MMTSFSFWWVLLLLFGRSFSLCSVDRGSKGDGDGDGDGEGSKKGKEGKRLE